MKINLSLILAVVLLSYSCETENVNVKPTHMIIDGAKIEVYVIDICEYVGRIHNSSADILVHKGNCIYCLKRQKL